MTSFAHTGSTFEKSCLSMKYTEFSFLFTGVNCAYILLIAAEKLNFENFNDVIRAYRKYIWKSCLSIKYAEFSPVFTGINCAYIWLIAVEKLNFENLNDVIRAYRKYFRKSCFSMKYEEFSILVYSLAQTAHIYCV